LDSFNQRFIFTPQKDNNQSVFFTYRAHDDELYSNIGRVDIDIHTKRDIIIKDTSAEWSLTK
jgi:hypothetical protein